MTKNEQAEILGYQGGGFIEYTDEVSGVTYPDACETVSIVQIDPSSQTFLVAMDLFTSFQQFAAGDAKADQTGAAHRSRAMYKQVILTKDQYKWFINTNWEAVAAYMGIVRGLVEMSDEDIEKAVTDWKAAQSG